MPKKRNDTEYIGEYDFKNHKIMHTMEKEKRDNFIMVAMKEFIKGYAVANTDEIVKAAGISKGLLFHYFGSKRGLFLFLLKYALDIVNTEYDKVILESSDFLENIWSISKLVIDLTCEYPTVYGFLVKSSLSLNEVFPEGIPKDVSNSSEAIMQRVLKYSNKSLFKDDVDVEKAQNIIFWTMNGFTDRVLSFGSDIESYQARYDSIMNEFEEYLNILRKMFYK